MSTLMQNQFVELKKQKQAQMQIGGDIKRRKLVVINQNCIEPLQALRAGGNEVLSFRLSPVPQYYFKSPIQLDLDDPSP